MNVIQRHPCLLNLLQSSNPGSFFSFFPIFDLSLCVFDCFSFCWDVAALLSAFLVFTIAVDFEVSFFLPSFLLELIEYMYIYMYLTLLAFLFEGCALCLPLLVSVSRFMLRELSQSIMQEMQVVIENIKPFWVKKNGFFLTKTFLHSLVCSGF